MYILNRKHSMKFSYLIFAFALAVNLSSEAQVIVKPNDPHIHYSGRIAFTDSAAVLSWSGTSVKINFTGDNISFRMHEEGDDYYTEIFDGKVIGVIHPDTDGSMKHTLSGLTSGTHSLE